MALCGVLITNVITIERESKCHMVNLTVTCTGINEKETTIGDEINLISPPELNSIELIIDGATFVNNVLKENWLDTLDSHTKISKLNLKHCTLVNIEKGAFSYKFFQALTDLKIVESGLQELRQDMFEGLGSLIHFTLTQYELRYELSIEEYPFEKSPILQIVDLDMFIISIKSLNNLFGKNGKYSPTLDILDLSRNKIDTIPDDAFVNAPGLVSLYLLDSGIQEIHEKAFWGNTMIQILDLTNNHLKTLKPLTFKSLTRQYSLFLSGNRWECDCDLQWLKDMYCNTNVINPTTPLKCSNGELFQNFDFCGTSEFTTDLPTTTISHGFTTLQCEISNYSNGRANSVEVDHMVQLVIENEVGILEFQELQQEPFEVKVVMRDMTSETLRNYYLLWFNSNNKSEYGCITPLNKTNIIHDLNRATTYTFSLVKENETEISPYAPFGFTTSPEWNDRAWILNSDKKIVLGVTLTFIIVLGFLIVIVTIFCMRRRYNQADCKNSLDSKCNDDYSYIDSTAATKTDDKPMYWEPHLGTTNHGYLTPKHNKYSRIRCRPSISQSVSEWSMYTTSAIYDESSYRNTEYGICNAPQYKNNYGRMNRHDVFKPSLPSPNLPMY
ncbi:hypothetical protein FQR65_LT09852 [Abscondita terminalis]|nr:hypothetical protein FQR65_LT09852 [Abscondita terminalis]